MDALVSSLTAHGFLRDGKLDLSDSIAVSRLLHALLEKHADHATQREALSSRLRTSTYDLERIQTFLERERAARAMSEREKEAEKAKAGAATKELATETDKLRATREELQKARTALRDVRTQAQYDQRRRERELQSTLQKWQRLAGAPSASAPGRMTLKSPLPPLAAISEASRGEIQLLEDSLSDLEAARQALVVENAELRGAITSIDTEMRSLLNSVGLTVNEAPESSASLPPALLEQQVAQLLARLVENINQRLDTYIADRVTADEVQAALKTSEIHSANLEVKLVDTQAELEIAQDKLRETEAALLTAQAALSASEASRLAQATAPASATSASAPDVEKERKRAKKAAKAEAAAVEAAKAVFLAPTPVAAEPVPVVKIKTTKPPSALAGILALTDSPSTTAPPRKPLQSRSVSQGR